MNKKHKKNDNRMINVVAFEKDQEIQSNFYVLIHCDVV